VRLWGREEKTPHSVHRPTFCRNIYSNYKCQVTASPGNPLCLLGMDRSAFWSIIMATINHGVNIYGVRDICVIPTHLELWNKQTRTFAISSFGHIAQISMHGPAKITWVGNGNMYSASGTIMTASRTHVRNADKSEHRQQKQGTVGRPRLQQPVDGPRSRKRGVDKL